MRAPGTKRGRRAAPATLSARLVGHVTLEARADGNIVARFDGHSVGLGKFSAGAADRAQELRTGLPLGSFASGAPDHRQGDSAPGPAIGAARPVGVPPRARAQRSARTRSSSSRRFPTIGRRRRNSATADVLVLSRFAYLRRRGNDDGAGVAARRRVVQDLRSEGCAPPSPCCPRRNRSSGSAGRTVFPGSSCSPCWSNAEILFKLDAASDSGLRPDEGDDNLVLWDFHDLLFHARSTEGRHANPMGGVYPYAGVMPPPPAVRPRWPGKPIDLREVPAARRRSRSRRPRSCCANGIRPAASTTSGRSRSPSWRAFSTAPRGSSRHGQARSTSATAVRWSSTPCGPIRRAGGSYGLELYLAVNRCEGLARGFYHYDAGGHALVPIGVRAHELDALLAGAEFAMDAPAAPQILITIAARFGRTSWKYSSLAYALILKDAGVLTQTLYLMATDMGLGGCAIGTANIDLFARMTGIEFHVEGPVGQFALGRGVTPETSG